MMQNKQHGFDVGCRSVALAYVVNGSHYFAVEERVICW